MSTDKHSSLFWQSEEEISFTTFASSRKFSSTVAENHFEVSLKIFNEINYTLIRNVLLVKKKMLYYTERPSLTLTVSTFCKNKRRTCQVPYSPTL